MSFLLDLIGSAADAGSKGIGEYQAQENALERQREAEKLAEERALAVDRIRSERAEADRQAKQKRMSQETQDVEAKAQVAGQERQLSAAQRMAPSIDGNVLDIIKSKLTPEQMQKFYGVKDDPLSRVDDQIGVARKEGYYDLEEQLKSAREATRKAIADDMKRQMDERKGERDDRRDDQRDRQLDIMASKVDASSGSGAVKLRSTYTDGEGRRIGVMSDGSTQVLSDRAFDFNKAVAGTVSAMSKADPRFARLPDAEKRSRAEEVLKGAGVANQGGGAAAPAGMTAIGKTPDGRIVYKTADGKQVVGK